MLRTILRTIRDWFRRPSAPEPVPARERYEVVQADAWTAFLLDHATSRKYPFANVDAADRALEMVKANNGVIFLLSLPFAAGDFRKASA